MVRGSSPSCLEVLHNIDEVVILLRTDPIDTLDVVDEFECCVHVNLHCWRTG